MADTPSTTPTSWRTTLGAVEQSIADCLSALDKYESAFHQALHEGIREQTAIVLPPIAAWDSKLAVAQQHTDDIEQLLAEQDSVWQNWRHKFATFQQLVGEAPPSLSSPSVRRPSDPHTN
jgi:hypothetical protein